MVHVMITRAVIATAIAVAVGCLVFALILQ